VAVQKSPVLTLRCQDWSETSQVIHLLARTAGRIRCLAKGSKRGQNPFGGPLDRWTLGEAVFSLRDPNRLATLTELYETERFEGLRRRLAAFYGASLATELVLTLVPDGETQPEVFDLTVGTFGRLSAAEPAACRSVALAFAWRLLGQLGYGSDLSRCVECGAAVGGVGAEFSAAAGGSVCRRCRSVGRVVRLSAKAVEAAGFLSAADWDEVGRVRLSEATAGSLRSALSARVEELAGRQLTAARYV